jgi:ATP-binding cassette, subfamily C (CFTR/MRP), member 1
MIILDDVLSALDATTERHIVDNLIGPKGLLKELGTTVLLITHASTLSLFTTVLRGTVT